MENKKAEGGGGGVTETASGPPVQVECQETMVPMLFSSPLSSISVQDLSQSEERAGMVGISWLGVSGIEWEKIAGNPGEGAVQRARLE